MGTMEYFIELVLDAWPCIILKANMVNVWYYSFMKYNDFSLIYLVERKAQLI